LLHDVMFDFSQTVLDAQSHRKPPRQLPMEQVPATVALGLTHAFSRLGYMEQWQCVVFEMHCSARTTLRRFPPPITGESTGMATPLTQLPSTAHSTIESAKLTFIAGWCPVCQHLLPRLVD
jgi:hypothetical protein